MCALTHLLPGGVVQVARDLAQADGRVGPDPRLLVPQQPGEVPHDHALVQVGPAQSWSQVEYGDDSLLPDCRLPVGEAALQLREDLVVHQLLVQVGGELVDLSSEPEKVVLLLLFSTNIRTHRFAGFFCKL